MTSAHPAPLATSSARWEFKLLYDGDCPLCSREVGFLRRRDRGRGRLALEDIAAPGFDAGFTRLRQGRWEAGAALGVA